MSAQSTVGILLAAGTGRRFDPTGTRNKLLQTLESHQPLVLRSAANMIKHLNSVVAVVNSEHMASVLQAVGCQTVICPDAALGMGTSLACAARYVALNYHEAHSVLIGLGDMPFINSDTYLTMLHRLHHGTDIAQPSYRDQPGHPVGFSIRHLEALQALHGDQGARTLLSRCSVTRIEIDDPGVLRDIDLPSDLPDAAI
jgi:molybdenum cofactor cytidylyltransferase